MHLELLKIVGNDPAQTIGATIMLGDPDKFTTELPAVLPIELVGRPPPPRCRRGCAARAPAASPRSAADREEGVDTCEGDEAGDGAPPTVLSRGDVREARRGEVR